MAPVLYVRIAVRVILAKEMVGEETVGYELFREGMSAGQTFKQVFSGERVIGEGVIGEEVLGRRYLERKYRGRRYSQRRTSKRRCSHKSHSVQ